MAKANHYIRVRWIHEYEELPVELYSELDSQGWELRKVEVFAGGRSQAADAYGGAGDTRLGGEPVLPIDEIALDPQFKPEFVDRREFEDAWRCARRSVARWAS
ncbi:DUF6881 domain-containing protein [Naumannella halotolerans]|uniref:DUF6881 domain-containing protein n=1 Tax=Naumannella halotolerans TaxID=993414 RepID=A0A4R7J9R6_9ACTN|nr:hypothetical protein [Naumannella halotolerans]TDT33253.1 hypothetical protein CLV29_0858 [Naumannella halotolerans]